MSADARVRARRGARGGADHKRDPEGQAHERGLPHRGGEPLHQRRQATREEELSDQGRAQVHEEQLVDNPRACAWGGYQIAFKDAAWAKAWKAGKSWDRASYAPQDRGADVRAAAKSGAAIVARNKTFALVDTWHKPSTLREKVFWNGGAYAGSVTAKVDYLVLGTDTMPATAAALKRPVP